METTEYNQVSIIIIVKNVKKYLKPYDSYIILREYLGEMTIQIQAKKIETDGFY